jgi:hypothetical protein
MYNILLYVYYNTGEVNTGRKGLMYNIYVYVYDIIYIVQDIYCYMYITTQVK